MRTQTEQNERTLEEVAPGERGVIPRLAMKTAR